MNLTGTHTHTFSFSLVWVTKRDHGMVSSNKGLTKPCLWSIQSKSYFNPENVRLNGFTSKDLFN